MKPEELKFSTEHMSADGVHLLMQTATNTKHCIFICTATKFDGMHPGVSNTEYSINGTHYNSKEEFIRAIEAL